VGERVVLAAVDARTRFQLAFDLDARRLLVQRRLVLGDRVREEVASALLDGLTRLQRRRRILVLLHGEDQLLENVFVELVLVSPRDLGLLQPRVDTEQPCLVEFLRLQQCVDPVFLALVEHLDLVLLLDERVLVLAEVGGADILYLVQLFIVFNLQGFTVGRGAIRRLQHEVFELCIFFGDRVQQGRPHLTN